MPRSRFRLLALDVDGTLLDSSGVLRPRTAKAVARASRAGLRPILCTGRRYRRALPIAQALGLDAPLVCNSGAIIKNPRNDQTLWRADFDPDLARDVQALFQTHDQPMVVFNDLAATECDFTVPAYPTGRALVDEYLSLNIEHALVQPAFSLAGRALFHVCAMGTRAEMTAFETVVKQTLGGRVQTYVQKSPRYTGTMCELLRHDAGKWTAIERLANEWGVDRSEICAVGDDVNDLAMIRHAGLGVAMGHAPDCVRLAADQITGHDDEDGLAMLVESLLLESQE